jgi:hypothetical protein
MFEIEKLDQLNIDEQNEIVCQDLAEWLEEQIEPYRISCSTHDINEVDQARKYITKVKNKGNKYFKSKRDEYNQKAKQIINSEKLALAPLIELEEELKLDIEEEKKRIKFAEKKAKLPARKALLNQHDLHIDDEFLLTLNDIKFQSQIDNMLAEIEQQKQREIQKQKEIEEAKKLTAEQAKKEAEQEQARKLFEQRRSFFKQFTDMELDAYIDKFHKICQMLPEQQGEAFYEIIDDLEKMSDEQFNKYCQVAKNNLEKRKLKKEEAEKAKDSEAVAQIQEKPQTLHNWLQSHQYNKSDTTIKLAQSGNKYALWKLVDTFEEVK